MEHLASGIAVGIVVLLIAFVVSRSVRYVGNDRVGIVERIWSRKGSITDGFIALHGEAGYQPEILRGGFHFVVPFAVRIRTESLVTIPQGQIGYIYARDGAPLQPTQTLASNVAAADFLNVRQFLADGGQKGLQRTLLREGVYAINLAQFIVFTAESTFGLVMQASDPAMFQKARNDIEARRGFEPIVIKDKDDKIGIVTVHDGPSIDPGQIIAPEVGVDPANTATYHNSFQDPEKFLAAGGRRGRQLQVLTDGTYIINRLFATVELVEKTVIEVGTVGVVVSYVGEVGKDTSGDDYRHGELVARGERGVWAEPLMPGKLAWNPYAGKIIMVPTTNFILRWQQDQVGQHRFDESLSEVTLITKDAFEPLLPLSVVVHIDYKKAPLVIQRFGDVKKLVEQTLDPMVSAYFKNSAQKKTLIELLQERSEIQEQAGNDMRTRFGAYSLELQEVLIGTPRSAPGDERIEQVLDQLRQRQVATERVETYAKQEEAAGAEQKFEQAKARAGRQGAITAAELNVGIAESEGKAEAKRAEQQAAKTITLARAEAETAEITGKGQAARTKVIAEADAERIRSIGFAEAETIARQVEASGGAEFQLRRQIVDRITTALEKTGVDVVPKTMITTGGAGGTAGSGSLIEALVGLTIARGGEGLGAAPAAPAAAPVEAAA